MCLNKTKALDEKDLLDDFFKEIVVLEVFLHGLCSIIQEFDKELHNEISLATYIQFSRVKEIVYKLIKSN